MPLVAYMTRKVFADGSSEIRIKHNQEITKTSIENARQSREKNKFLKKVREAYLLQRLDELKLTYRDYVQKINQIKKQIEYESNIRDFKNVYRSANRARQALYDICRCNEFQFFVTWTLDPEKVERLNDNVSLHNFKTICGSYSPICIM